MPSPWWRDEATALLGLSNWARALHWYAVELLGHTWSLGVDEQFYLVWVLVWLALMRLAQHLAAGGSASTLVFSLLAATACAWLAAEASHRWLKAPWQKAHQQRSSSQVATSLGR